MNDKEDKHKRRANQQARNNGCKPNFSPTSFPCAQLTVLPKPVSTGVSMTGHVAVDCLIKILCLPYRNSVSSVPAYHGVGCITEILSIDVSVTEYSNLVVTDVSKFYVCWSCLCCCWLSYRNSVTAGPAHVAVDCLTEILCLPYRNSMSIGPAHVAVGSLSKILCLLALPMLLLTALSKSCVCWPCPCCKWLLSIFCV